MLSDKVCIVAGGAGGLGKATAMELANLGASVVVNDLGTDLEGEGKAEEPAELTASEIRNDGGEAMAHFGDVSSLDYTEQLVKDTVETYGRIDGVINFAGVLADSISYKMTGDEWDRVMRVHLRGHFALLRNVAAHWRKRAKDEPDGISPQRSFICISSRAAYGNIGQINYATAKAGLIGFSKTAAKELERYNVRVNTLIPSGYTRMIDEVPEDARRWNEDEIPPEKIAPFIGYLMSDEAKDITGCTLRAIDEAVGIMAEPEVERISFKSGGWSAEEIAEQFRETVGRNMDLNKTGSLPF